MDKQICAERLSSLLDGELSEKELDALLQELHDESAAAEILAKWDAFQQIGATLRGEANVTMRPDFASRVAAQLAHEPSHTAEVQAAPMAAVAVKSSAKAEDNLARRLSKKWMALAAAAGAALTALTMLSAPQLMVAVNAPVKSTVNSPVNNSANVQMASHSNKPVTLLANSTSVDGTEVVTTNEMIKHVLADGKPSDFVYLRDPQFDQYLLAHQRFSPSVYSTAQYARSAAFANEKDK
ncbi:MAG: sigma-E factor negative regulatory protein [Burkholderiales bacterium]|nr:sigma-E factor negative regulatory protein [Burkholderiales bacterium]